MSETDAISQLANARRLEHVINGSGLLLRQAGVVPLPDDAYDLRMRVPSAAMNLATANCEAAELKRHLAYLRHNRNPDPFDLLHHFRKLCFMGGMQLNRAREMWDLLLLKAEVDIARMRTDPGAVASCLREWCIDATEVGAQAYTVWSSFTEKPEASLPKR